MHTVRIVFPFVAALGAAAPALATPIAFTQTTYTSFAQADAGTATDGPDTGVSVAGLPLSSAAAAASPDGDVASAVAFADHLFLTTTSEARPAVGLASGNAVSTFSGIFDVVPGQIDLSFVFDTFVDTLAGGIASNALAVTLTVDNVTLFDALITDPGVFSQQFALNSGGAGLLDLSLIGTTFADPTSYAFTLATVNAALDARPFAVREPAMTGLLLAGFAGFAWTLRRRTACVQAAPDHTGIDRCR